MTTASRKRDGSRHIDLYVPFSYGDQTIETITFKAVVLDVTLRWQDGMIDGVMALMSELSGLPQKALAQIRYPDANFVMDEFMAHLPQAISASIAEGRIPVYEPKPERVVTMGPEPAFEDPTYDPTSPEAIEGDNAIREFRQRQIEALPEGTQITPGYGGYEGLAPDEM